MSVREYMTETVCPWCNYRANLVTRAAEILDPTKPTKVRFPGDGDASVCLGCGQISVFAFKQPGGLRFPTAEEQTKLVLHPLYKQMKAGWSDMVKDTTFKDGSRPILHRPEWSA